MQEYSSKNVTQLLPRGHTASHTRLRLTLDVCSSGTGKNTGKKKKCQLAVKTPALFLPQPPQRLLSSLSSACTSFLFLFFTISLFSACGQYRLGHTFPGSHQLSRAQRWAGCVSVNRKGSRNVCLQHAALHLQRN